MDLDRVASRRHFYELVDKTTFLKFRAALMNLDYDRYPLLLREMILGD